MQDEAPLSYKLASFSCCSSLSICSDHTTQSFLPFPFVFSFSSNGWLSSICSHFCVLFLNSKLPFYWPCAIKQIPCDHCTFPCKSCIVFDALTCRVHHRSSRNCLLPPFLQLFQWFTRLIFCLFMCSFLLRCCVRFLPSLCCLLVLNYNCSQQNSRLSACQLRGAVS